jgi:wobble nucleotide-excising tRNase
MKLVIEVNQSKDLENDDIIVFNGTLNTWEYKSKDKYLIGLKNDILQRKKEIKKLNEEIEEMKKDISSIAKIIKEGLQ